MRGSGNFATIAPPDQALIHVNTQPVESALIGETGIFGFTPEGSVSTDRTKRLRGTSRTAGWLTAALLVLAPALALGADISWKSTVTSGPAMGGGKFTRLGTAVLGTGETAEYKAEGTDGAIDDRGRPTVAVETVMRFKDGSTITTRHQGYRDPKTLDVGGSGQFVGGTGKYQGISGQYTYKGSIGSTDAVGTYTLKK